jgi:hypothetical protein
MTRDDLIETLAAIEHQRWADWQKYLHSKLYNPGGGADKALPTEWWERWERQIVQPYAMLSEAEKCSDRDQVMRYWPVIVEFVAEWLQFRAPLTGAQAALDAWREEMGDE